MTLHSEYRSTYRWHEYTGPRQEVVRRPPQTNVAEKANDVYAARTNDEEFHSDTLSKLEPAMPRRKKYPDLAYRRHEFLVSDGGGNEFINEDRARGHTSRRDAAGSTPRKSHSMGALKARAQANAMVHKKRIDMENKDASELEPLVDDRHNQDIPKEEFHSEYKKKFRPFSQYEFSTGALPTKDNPIDVGVHIHKNFTANNDKSGAFVELRKKAGEYKHRGWGSELAPERLSDIYNKQIELWDQVSRRSSLSALSLASMTHKSYTKEEKEDDNNRKSSPTKAYRNAENSARMIRDIIRHHLERTTGGSELDGLILSPTREKLEPTIPRRDDDSRGSQKNSPKKSSPMKSASLKRTNQKSKQVRSQSVGPTTDTNIDKKSPKRQSRSTAAKDARKSSNETPSNKRPRPSSLNTTVSSRSKSSSVVTKNEDDRLAKPLQNQNKSQSIDSTKQNQKVPTKHRNGNNEAEEIKPEYPSADVKDTTSTTEDYDSINYEPVIKSPPEPTRVKSPEQIIMRSPDPVNWTVPLDTGKTFTVTQNVREGDLGSRPHSEVKAWTPPEVPLPVAQSAPPTLIEQSKEEQAGMGISTEV